MAMILSDMLQAQLNDSIMLAKQKSMDGCVRHVNATVSCLRSGEFSINFYVDEWYSSGQTVKSYVDGQEI